MTPLVGITTYGLDVKAGFILPADYVEAVHRAGGAAVLIPQGQPSPETLLDRLDALILAGGGDLDPTLYGGRAHPTVYMVDAGRDLLDLALARTAIETGLPTLGICRGCQVINVALGGTLHEHLPDVYGESTLHRLPPCDPVPHPIRATASSRVAAIMGQAECLPSSWHHQAIRDVARPLTVVAHAPDGVIEAVEHPAHPWLIAVQWHPERTAAVDPTQQRLFDALVQAARPFPQLRPLGRGRGSSIPGSSGPSSLHADYGVTT